MLEEFLTRSQGLSEREGATERSGAVELESELKGVEVVKTGS